MRNPLLATRPLRQTGTDREIWALALPALGALLAEPAYVLADTAVIGHVGTAELGGLGLATQVIGTVVAVSIFLAYGTTSAVSRLLGAGKPQRAAHQAVQGLWIALCAGVLFGFMCFVAAPWLMRLLRAPDGIEHFGVRYLRISTLGFPAMLVMLAGVGYLRGLKDTRRPLLVAAFTAAGNLGLELFLVFRLGFGVGASALSTVLFQWLGAAAYLRWITKAAAGHGADWRPHLRSIRALGRDGLALLARTSALRASFIVAAALAASMGEVPLASHEIATQLFFFVAMGLDAVAIAAQAMIGTLLGAEDPERAKQVAYRVVWWGVALGIGASVIVLSARGILPSLFSNDQAVVDQTRSVMLALAVMQPVGGLVFALDGILIGAGDLAYLAKAMVISSAVFIAAAAVVGAVGGGVVLLWLALIAFMAVRGATTLWRLMGNGWLVVGARSGGTTTEI